MAKVNISFNAFTAITDSAGEYKTWGDTKDGGYLTPLTNSEIFGSVLKAPEEVTGTNISFEYTTFPTGQEWDDNSDAPDPVVQRVMFNMPLKRLQLGYKIDLFGEKEAIEWSKYLGAADSTRYTQIMNFNNQVAIQAVQDYAIATGQVKVLTNLGVQGKTALNYFNDTALIADGANSIMSGQTIVNLGLPMERISILAAPNVMRQITSGIAGTNVSQGAFDAVKSGRINNLFGYSFDTSIYLGKKLLTVKGYPFDSTKVLGIVYNLDSLGFYQQGVKAVNTPTDQGHVTRNLGWLPFASMIPSREHTSFVLMNAFPTIAEINAARLKLFTANPGPYAKLPGGKLNVITAEEYTAMSTLSTEFTFEPVPNVEGPAVAKEAEDVKKGIFR